MKLHFPQTPNLSVLGGLRYSVCQVFEANKAVDLLKTTLCLYLNI